MEKGLFGGGIAPVDGDKNEQLLDQALQERNNIKVMQVFEKVTYFDDSLTEQCTAYFLASFCSRSLTLFLIASLKFGLIPWIPSLTSAAAKSSAFSLSISLESLSERYR